MPSHIATSPAKILFAFTITSLLLFGCSQSLEATPPPAAITTETPIATNTPDTIRYSGEGNLIFLSIEENGHAHLFVQSNRPQDLPLTRITNGEWNDIAPALSPDRTMIAFASDRNGGYWDLFTMNLQSGDVTQITNTPEYDSAPSWSPDGQWLVFETYTNENLEISVVSVNDRTQPIIPVTQDSASDHSPVWAPDGRHIAFISLRGGESDDVWLADLDLTGEDRYQNLSNTPFASENHPVWNYDGSQLLWASISQTVGFSGLYIWEANDPNRTARWIGDGIWGAWNETAEQIIAITSGPNQQYISSYDVRGNLLLPPTPLHGRVRGLAWGLAQIPTPFPNSFNQAAIFTPAALWSPIITPGAEVPNQRWYVVALDDVQAPFPQLHDLIDDSFNALRDRIILETGWDVLASIENAFVPLTTNLEPGLEEDWLYTGRAFAINTLMTDAGWMVVLREDVGAQTYWRIYVRANTQDGSFGEPIHNAPWNLSARYELDPRTYEQGGKYAPVPAGYWVDITALAAAYNWERLPALPNWRTYYAGSRFTEFTLTNGLTWYAAMQELYPAEALITPTRVLPPTLTPTQTPSITPTPRPSRTPRPTSTPSSTRTPSVTPTPSYTPTLTPTPPTIIP